MCIGSWCDVFLVNWLILKFIEIGLLLLIVCYYGSGIMKRCLNGCLIIFCFLYILNGLCYRLWSWLIWLCWGCVILNMLVGRWYIFRGLLWLLWNFFWFMFFNCKKYLLCVVFIKVCKLIVVRFVDLSYGILKCVV